MSEAIRYTLRTRLCDLLPRLRLTIPLTIEPERIYRGAFPPKLAQWFIEDKPSETQLSNVGYQNLMRIAARNTIIHFHLGDVHWSTTHGNGPYTLKPFWVRLDNAVSPSSKLMPFMLNDTVRTDPVLQAWYEAATQLEHEIAMFKQKIYEITPLFTNRTDVAKAWPSIARAVPEVTTGLRISPEDLRMRNPRTDEIRLKINRILMAPEQDRLAEMLATAVLLPDTKLKAWIGTNREEE